MLKVIFLFGLMSCLNARHNCGETPELIYLCMNSPKVVRSNIVEKCVYTSVKMTQCEAITCIYQELDWLKGKRVKKPKVWYHYDRFAREHPEWGRAVQHFKTYCLERDLLPQGIYMDCEAYDITHCAFSSFIKYAPLYQWSQSAECASSIEYAATCPVCPSSCFAQAIPAGSCNACYAGNPRG